MLMSTQEVDQNGDKEGNFLNIILLYLTLLGLGGNTTLCWLLVEPRMPP